MAPRLLLMLTVLAVPLGPLNTQRSTCERDLAQCQASVRQLTEQLRTRDKGCGSLKQELADARLEAQRNKDAYQKVKDDCGRQIAAVRKECESARTGEPNNNLAECSRALSNAQKEAQSCQRENARNISLIADLRKQASAPELERQLSAARQEADKYRSGYEQLSSQNADLKARYSNLDSSSSNLKNAMAELTRSRTSFQQQLGAASQQLNEYRSENSKLAMAKTNLDRQVAELVRRLNDAGAHVPEPPKETPNQTHRTGASDVPPDLTYNPEALLTWSKAIEQRATENGDRAGGSYEKDGKTHVISQLVIGTLETVYDPNVRPGKAFPVEATFTPHPILKIPQSSADTITWHLELQYYSSRIKEVRYDSEMSGRKDQRREIRLDGPAETWGWELVAPRDFQKDRSEIIVFAGSSLPNQEPALTDITREPVDLVEKETPSGFAVALAFIKDNLTYILGLISLLVAIWATLLSIKKSKLEVRLKEIELAPRS